MAKIKITREELQHDEVLETADHAVHWLRDNLRLILAIVIVALATYAVVGTLHSRRQQGLMAANNLLSEASDRYNAAIQESGWASPERQAAMREVIALAQRVIDQHPGTPLARQAMLLQGNAYYMAGDDVATSREGAPNTNEAINSFTRFVAEAKTPFEVTKGKLALAGAYENMFFLVARPDFPTTFQEDARRTYLEVVNDTATPAFMRAEALLALGRLYAFQNQPEQAKLYYRQVLDMRHQPLAPVTDMASNRAIIQQLDQRASLFTLAGTARLELQRLGVDVDAEYPLIVEQQ
ncbi:MAG: tetratricopeptide repeat protein [Candidatus Sumerlaeia bacterium]|nr:tetratricopeptide repeat protein [Candidatus Sumerlaeia bacterium]